MSEYSRSPLRWYSRVIRTPRFYVSLLILGHVGLLLYSSLYQFPTRNEVAHVPAGLSYWATGHCSLYCVNPPLSKMLAVLPCFFLSPDIECIDLPEYSSHRIEFQVAHRFAFVNQQNYFSIIWAARLSGIACSSFGAYLVYRWTSELCGTCGGFVSLLLWCIDPNIIAHAQLATPDMPATVTGFFAMYAFRQYLIKSSWTLVFITGVLIGIAELMKFTLVVLYPICWLLFILNSYSCVTIATMKRCVSVRIVQMCIGCVISVVIINAGYGFEGSLTPLKHYRFVSALLTGPIRQNGLISGNRFDYTWLGEVYIPLPRDYVYGIDVQRRDFEKLWPSYLWGHWREGGWWYYYLSAMAIKIPCGTIVLVCWSLIIFCGRKSRSRALEDFILLMPAAGVLVCASSQTGLNSHMRYILPLAPFVITSAGRTFNAEVMGRWRTALVLPLCTWSCLSSLSVYPHSLSYFNELVGGPLNGHKYLLGSNLDWGQDLFYFKKWAENHPEAHRIGLAYFNYIDYRIVGTEYCDVPVDLGVVLLDGSAARLDQLRVGPYPGWFAVDIYSMKEGNYRYFEWFTPVARAGYSILIYHLELSEVNEIRRLMKLSMLPEFSE